VVILVNAQNKCSPEAAQKILRTVPYAQGFHFFMPDGHYTGETALSLRSFLRDMGSVDMQSIKFHIDRGDFQKWLRTTIGDEGLAQTIDKLDKKIPEESLLEKLTDIVQKRISELQSTR
jgi:alpha-amylase